MGSSEATWERRADGSVLIARKEPLLAPPSRLTDRFVHWARTTPERVFLAEQDSAGNWLHITWAEALSNIRSIAQALIERGLGPQRPVAILSENSIEHGLLA